VLIGQLGDRGARNAQPLGEVVTDTLELSQIEQPRIPAPRAPWGDGPDVERSHKRSAQLPLQPSDLLAHRPPGGPLGVLGDTNVRSPESRDRNLRTVDFLP
jgi:hypothetical protein